MAVTEDMPVNDDMRGGGDVAGGARTAWPRRHRWRAVRWLSPWVPLALSLLLVAGLGAVSFVSSSSAAGHAEAIHRQDRAELQSVLGVLASQYLTFAAHDLSAAADDGWELTPGSSSDGAQLRRALPRLPLLGYGVALLGLDGSPLGAASDGRPLPAPDDPVLRKAVLSMPKTGWAVSDVTVAGAVPLVAISVPVMDGKDPVAILMGFADVRSWPLQGYVAELPIDDGHAVVLDSGGTVVAGTPDEVGQRLGQPAALDARATPTGVIEYDGPDGPSVVAHSPVGIAGWSGLMIESADAFYGPLRTGHLHVELALLGLLVVAAGAVLVLSFKRHRAVRRLAESALVDPLTGAASRRRLDLELAGAVARADRSHLGLTLCVIDLDGFKPVNDAHGHSAGDAVLAAAVARMTAAVRPFDLVARTGGDEFVVLAEGVHGPVDVEALAERLRAAVGQPVELPTRQVTVTGSVGAATTAPGPVCDADTLWHAADLAMYAAKERGSGTHTVVVAATSTVAGTPAAAGELAPAPRP